MKTVFYAWQSELQNNTNRTFIESCLEKAIAKVNQSVHSDDKLVLDKDTQGYSGMPDVSRVIFDKIDTCAVFCPDLSITYRSDEGRCSPNANVLIELGYALRAIGDRRIVGLFNEATGKRDELPFDLRTRRWPLTYCLREGASQEERKKVREWLVKSLTEALGAAASRAEGQSKVDGEGKGKVGSVFESIDTGRYPNGHVIAHVDAGLPGVGSKGEVVWREAPQAYIELRPTPGTKTESLRDLMGLAVNDHFSLRAFGPRGTQWVSRNQDGVITGDIVSNPQQNRALCVSQLRKNTGALVGVNQALVAHDGEKEVILAGMVSAQFADALENYLAFYRQSGFVFDHLSLFVGFENIHNLYLKVRKPKGLGLQGPIVDGRIYHSVEKVQPTNHVSEVLQPLFKKLWDSAGEEYEA
ncbi:MAG: hypothetical protein U1F39_00905 [Steroidobacteraceae bacterium]